MDNYELHSLLWSEWTAWKEKHPVLWMVPLQYYDERHNSAFRTQQVPDSDHQLLSFSSWFCRCDHECPISVHRGGWGSPFEKQKCQDPVSSEKNALQKGAATDWYSYSKQYKWALESSQLYPSWKVWEPWWIQAIFWWLVIQRASGKVKPYSEAVYASANEGRRLTVNSSFTRDDYRRGDDQHTKNDL